MQRLTCVCIALQTKRTFYEHEVQLRCKEIVCVTGSNRRSGVPSSLLPVLGHRLREQTREQAHPADEIRKPLGGFRPLCTSKWYSVIRSKWEFGGAGETGVA